ncbi:MAG: DNA-binding response regulator [Chloroflexi bacterium HGW-Chloroflexi-8]|jgi:two-component system response regulator MprA|nr:MAG: DNA-binding response regulator [Chloroflexi bacterium HGW-Chloroflexi-8]
MSVKILIIEDNLEFADYLRRGLTYEGYLARFASDAETGLSIQNEFRPDLLILDIMLPGMDGIEACMYFREIGFAFPVLMLTARNSIGDRVTGLDAGADDYLGKPFEFEELLARIRALLRRTIAGEKVMSFSNLDLDLSMQAAYRNEKSILLTKTEYEMLVFFLSHPREVISREVLLNRFWGFDQCTGGNVLDVYVGRLRRKLGEPVLIHTVFGVGYILKEEER